MNSNSYTLSFISLLTLPLIVFKLGGVLDWSWWWILAPLWAPLAIAIAIFLFLLLVALAMLSVVAIGEIFQ